MVSAGLPSLFRLCCRWLQNWWLHWRYRSFTSSSCQCRIRGWHVHWHYYPSGHPHFQETHTFFADSNVSKPTLLAYACAVRRLDDYIDGKSYRCHHGAYNEQAPLVFADTLTGYLQECIDKTGIVSKALLSFAWHHEWDSVQATLQSVSAVLFLF